MCIKLSSEQLEQIRTEGWDIFSIDSDDKEFQIQKDDEAGVFEYDDDAWKHIIEKAKQGSALHGYVLNQFKSNHLKEYDKYFNETGATKLDSKDNYRKVFFLADGSEVFIYSDNSEWQALDGDLAISDVDGYPVWGDDNVVANGTFKADDFEIYQHKMRAALEAFTLMDNDELALIDDDAEEQEQKQSINSLSLTYGGALSEEIGLDLTTAIAVILEHLKEVIPTN
jgi:hypothetical protein